MVEGPPRLAMWLRFGDDERSAEICSPANERVAKLSPLSAEPRTIDRSRLEAETSYIHNPAGSLQRWIGPGNSCA